MVYNLKKYLSTVSGASGCFLRDLIYLYTKAWKYPSIEIQPADDTPIPGFALFNLLRW